MLISVGIYGFFYASSGPTLAETTCLITGTKLFSIGYGFILLGNGFGWLMGAPVAGMNIPGGKQEFLGIYFVFEQAFVGIYFILTEVLIRKYVLQCRI